jgi:hypothetical protein
MQITWAGFFGSPPPVVFWFRIVSIRSALLPVWRSPMISSRWPRPIGIIASIALMPVWSGSLTGWRSGTDGAGASIGRQSFSVTPSGPLPSRGSPSAFTTRPRSASPVGTEMTRPVERTVSPSLTLVASPRSTQPTLSSSRFSARPRTPFGNSSSSLIMQSSRPCTRDTPSPTESTVPTDCIAVSPW